jgi:hypothetical protein
MNFSTILLIATMTAKRVAIFRLILVHKLKNMEVGVEEKRVILVLVAF